MHKDDEIEAAVTAVNAKGEDFIATCAKSTRIYFYFYNEKNKITNIEKKYLSVK